MIVRSIRVSMLEVSRDDEFSRMITLFVKFLLQSCTILSGDNLTGVIPVPFQFDGFLSCHLAVAS